MSKTNNWAGRQSHDCCPWRQANPRCFLQFRDRRIVKL